MPGAPHSDRHGRTAASPEKAPGGCPSSVGPEGRDLTLTLSCKDCPERSPADAAGAGPLSNPRCLRNALEALASEPGVDTLILSGHIETQIQSGGTAMLGRVVALANDLHQLSLREPPPGSRDCGRCGARPGLLFRDLRGVLLSDPAEFAGGLKSAIGRLQAGASMSSGEVCRRCLGDTSGDIAFLAESFEELARHIVKQGFQIVV